MIRPDQAFLSYLPEESLGTFDSSDDFVPSFTDDFVLPQDDLRIGFDSPVHDGASLPSPLSLSSRDLLPFSRYPSNPSSDINPYATLPGHSSLDMSLSHRSLDQYPPAQSSPLLDFSQSLSSQSQSAPSFGPHSSSGLEPGLGQSDRPQIDQPLQLLSQSSQWSAPHTAHQGQFNARQHESPVLPDLPVPQVTVSALHHSFGACDGRANCSVCEESEEHPVSTAHLQDWVFGISVDKATQSYLSTEASRLGGRVLMVKVAFEIASSTSGAVVTWNQRSTRGESGHRAEFVFTYQHERSVDFVRIYSNTRPMPAKQQVKRHTPKRVPCPVMPPARLRVGVCWVEPNAPAAQHPELLDFTTVFRSHIAKSVSKGKGAKSTKSSSKGSTDGRRSKKGRHSRSPSPVGKRSRSRSASPPMRASRSDSFSTSKPAFVWPSSPSQPPVSFEPVPPLPLNVETPQSQASYPSAALPCLTAAAGGPDPVPCTNATPPCSNASVPCSNASAQLPFISHQLPPHPSLNQRLPSLSSFDVSSFLRQTPPPFPQSPLSSASMSSAPISSLNDTDVVVLQRSDSLESKNRQRLSAMFEKLSLAVKVPRSGDASEVNILEQALNKLQDLEKQVQDMKEEKQSLTAQRQHPHSFIFNVSPSLGAPGNHQMDFTNIFRYSAMPQGIVSVATPGLLVDVNPMLAHLLHYSRDELNGKMVNEILHTPDVTPKRRICAGALLQKLVSGAALYHRGIRRYRTKFAQILVANVTLWLTRDASGAPMFCVFLLEPIRYEDPLSSMFSSEHPENPESDNFCQPMMEKCPLLKHVDDPMVTVLP